MFKFEYYFIVGVGGNGKDGRDSSYRDRLPVINNINCCTVLYCTFVTTKGPRVANNNNNNDDNGFGFREG